MYSDGPGSSSGRLPDLPMPRPPRRGLRLAAAVTVAVLLCAAVMVTLRVLGTGSGSGAGPAVRHFPRSDVGARLRRVPAAVPASAGIYRLLPLTSGQLTAAAHVATAFTSAYGTYSWVQPVSAYVGRLRPYASAELQAQLAHGSAAPGLLQQRARDHASATSTATVTAIRDIAGNTVTFTVTARETVRSRGTARTTVSAYAVTVAPDADGPVAYDIEPATTGQAGSGP